MKAQFGNDRPRSLESKIVEAAIRWVQCCNGDDDFEVEESILGLMAATEAFIVIRGTRQEAE